MAEKTTHINIYARVRKNSGVRGVGWDVSVEFLTIPVPAIRVSQKTELKIILRFSPLDAVQLVPLHVIVAHQLHPVGEDRMGWDWLLRQSDCPDSWRQGFIICNLGGRILSFRSWKFWDMYMMEFIPWSSGLRWLLEIWFQKEGVKNPLWILGS